MGRVTTMASTLKIAPGTDRFELMLSGQLDAGTVDQLQPVLEEFSADQPIVVDVAGLDAIDRHRHATAR